MINQNASPERLTSTDQTASTNPLHAVVRWRLALWIGLGAVISERPDRPVINELSEVVGQALLEIVHVDGRHQVVVSVNAHGKEYVVCGRPVLRDRLIEHEHPVSIRASAFRLEVAQATSSRKRHVVLTEVFLGNRERTTL